MLNLKLADAYVDLYLERKRFDSGLQSVQARLKNLPKAHTVRLDVDRMRATSSLNLFMQQLRSANAQAKSLTKFGLSFSGGFGGGRGGMGGGGFISGLGMGMGLPFTTSPQMMAGQMLGSAVSGSVTTAAGLQSQIAELRRVTGMQAGVADAFKKSLFGTGVSQAGVSINDLMEIAQIGGRSGVADREGPAGLLTFTKDLAMVKNAVADMPTEELASSMTKVLNVFGLGTDRVAGFGSALTAMDNVSVASARDILAITTGLSGTAEAIGMTLPQTLAFASVLKDVGLTNQLAAGSFSQIFRKMASDSKGFAEEIEVDAKVFADAYRRDPMEALGMVINKFKEMGDTIKGQEFLKGLGFTGVRTAGSLQQLATKFDDVAKRAKIASSETGSLNALMVANSLKSNTLEAAWTKLKNSLVVLADTMGGSVIGRLTDVTNALTGITTALARGDWGMLGNVFALSAFGTHGPLHDPGKGGQVQMDMRRALEDWLMTNVLGGAPNAPAIGAGGLNALPANKAPFVGPPAPDRDKHFLENAIAEGWRRVGNAQAAIQDLRGGMVGAGMRGLARVPGMGAEATRPTLMAGLSGEDIGRRIQEDILNMTNKATEETAKNTRPLAGLLTEAVEILRRGAQQAQGAFLGQ